jgi:methyl-accepting chemotaxis protein
MLAGLDKDSLALQSAYIAQNPYALGEKDSLIRPHQEADHHSFHGLYHRHIRDYLQKFQYYYLFLVDHVAGDIIYSVFKELDYTTSLIDGPYANSGIGQAFKLVKNSNDPALYSMSFYLKLTPLTEPVLSGLQASLTG